MSYTVVVLGVWCIIQVIIAIWGLGIINNRCQDLSLYTKLRTLFVVSAVSATLFFANLICNNICYKDQDDETSFFIPGITFLCSLIIIITEVQISTYIKDCPFDTDTYKMMLLYGGIIPSIFPLLYSLVMGFRKGKKLMEKARLKQQILSQQQKIRKTQKEIKETKESSENLKKLKELKEKTNEAQKLLEATTKKFKEQQQEQMKIKKEEKKEEEEEKGLP